MAQTTVPTHYEACECDMCEDSYIPPTLRAPDVAKVMRVPNVSPLARAALDNGVSFADVQAYCERRQGPVRLPLADYMYCALFESSEQAFTDAAADVALESALARSFLAQTDGSIAAARIWWHGVLP